MAHKMKAVNRWKVDKSLVAMFLRMSPEERLLANDNAVRGIMELKNAYQMLVELKRSSKDTKDKQRLIVLEETLRQLQEE